ncbi:uncharacterized protein LOC124845563 [Vigna umbellata]|uniref:uncharacterized protein LOC124845563 n=1 Tax=Vigna umbellata TaxID=87088 RepID=UPI001F5F755E|nr:uncharacterized protein LOC124845563 [Vigna umbellata]
MESKERITEYITWVEKVDNQLGRNGEQMPSSRVVEKILRSLTKDFESIMCVIEETKDLLVLTVDELAGSLEAHEQKRRSWDDQVELDNQALQVQFDSNKTQITQSRGPGGRGRGSRGRSGHGRGNFENKNEEQTDQQNWRDQGQEKDRGDRSRVECFKCGKYGYYANECRSSKCYNFGKAGHIAKYCKAETKGETNLLTEDVEELLLAKSSDTVDMENSVSIMDEVILVKGATNVEKKLKQKDEEIQRIGRLLDEANEIMNKQRVELEKLKKTTLQKEEKAYNILEPDKNREEEDEEQMKADEISTNSAWYLDTRASNHMCANENFFYKLTKVEAKFMSFVDDSKVVVKWCGKIRHMQKNG